MTFSSDAPLVANQVGNTDFPDNFEDFHEIFEREYKKLLSAVNSKEGGLYLPQELATFNEYFDRDDPQNMRNVYRIVVDFGVLPNATEKRVPHNITFNANVRLTRLFGGSSNPSSIQFIPLPFCSTTLLENVMLEADQEDIIITTGSDRSSFKETTVVMEYTK